MTQIIAIALNTFKEAVRNRILYILLLFAIIIMASGGIISDLSISSEDKIIKDLGVASINFFGLLIAIFVGIGLVYNEIDKKTLYTIVSKPIDRYQFILGKYFGLLLTVYVNVIIMTLFFIGSLYYRHFTSGEYIQKYFSNPNFDISQGIPFVQYSIFMIKQIFSSIYHTLFTFFKWDHLNIATNVMPVIFMTCIELAIVTAFAVLFSASSSPTLSAVLTIFTFIIGRMNEDIIRYAMKIQKDGLTSFGKIFKYHFANVSAHIMPNLEKFNLRSDLIYSDSITINWFSVFYGVMYVIMILMISMIIFSRRNFK